MTDEQQILFDKLTRLEQGVALMKVSDPTLSNVDAYIYGGGTATDKNSIGATASRMLNNVNVVNFVNSFKAERISETIMSRDEMLNDLTIIARGSVFDLIDLAELEDDDVVSFGNNRLVVKSLSSIPNTIRKLVKKIKPGKYGLEIEFHDPMTARKMLADMQGFNAPVKQELVIDSPRTLDDFYGDA